MSGGRWDQLEQTFAEAMQLQPEARDAFVHRTCGADLELRTNVLSLLAAAEQSAGFMASPALDRLAQAVAGGGWSLREGQRVGAYTVLRLLGAGGAGEVWRARDDRLGRDVAIKVLLPRFGDDSAGFARFASEARLAGALNHPNVLTVYDVGEHNGMPFLVTECLEGQSLRQRIGDTPLDVDEAVSIALAVAGGLAAAHARGIVHRDLKPENVFIKSDGSVKILDFGLATLRPTAAAQPAPTQTMSGVLVGTAGYMAPEQVRGEAADARADLFAAGVILFEMVGGRRPFAGGRTFEALHVTLSAEPPDLVALNPRVPAPLAQIVKRLLKKAPDARFQAAADLAWALEQVAARTPDASAGHATATVPESRRGPSWLRWVVAPVAAAALLVAAGWLGRARAPEPAAPPLLQFTWTLPAGMGLESIPVMSPDGSRAAFVGRDADGSRLFVRELASPTASPLPGTDGARQPFWSPDGRSLGFFARGKLLRVATASGAPVVLADALDPRGGAWGPSGTIVFSPDLNLTALMKVAAAGGPVEPATVLDRTKGENSHRWPVFLPDGRRFLYFVRSSADERRGVYLGRLDAPATSPATPILQTESEAVYVPPSATGPAALLLAGSGGIEVRPFDTEQATLVGEPRALDLRVPAQTPYNSAMLSASPTVLAFSTAQLPFGLRLGSANRDGSLVQLQDGEPQNWPRLSPDGTRLARQRIDGVRGIIDIWVEDLVRGTRVRATHSDDPDIFPVWSPDGTRIASVVGTTPGRPGQRRLSISPADGTGMSHSFPCPGGPGAYCEPTDWSADGKRLLVTVARDARTIDVWIVAADGSSSQPLLAEPYGERDARWSPDGRWVVYVTDESGKPEISVRSTVGPPRRVVLSSDGGEQPLWRRDGREVLFVDPSGHLRAAAVTRGPGGDFAFGQPALLPVPLIGSGHWGTQYRRDGRWAPRALHEAQRRRTAPRDPSRGRLARAASLAATPAAEPRQQHRDAPAILAILGVHGGEIPLFQLDADQDVCRRGQRQHQSCAGHDRDRPAPQQEAEIQRMADEAIEAGRDEAGRARRHASPIGEDLPQPQHLEPVDERCRHQHDHPAGRGDQV